jgi:hypothetical protein
MMGLVAAGSASAVAAAAVTATSVKYEGRVAAPATRLILVERAGSRGKPIPSCVKRAATRQRQQNRWKNHHIVWDAVANTSVHETQKRSSGRAFSATWRTWTREPFSHGQAATATAAEQSCHHKTRDEMRQGSSSFVYYSTISNSYSS